jgi:hypothetical protein
MVRCRIHRELNNESARGLIESMEFRFERYLAR